MGVGTTAPGTAHAATPATRRDEGPEGRGRASFRSVQSFRGLPPSCGMIAVCSVSSGGGVALTMHLRAGGGRSATLLTSSWHCIVDAQTWCEYKL